MSETAMTADVCRDLSIEQAAKRLGKNPSTIRRWIREKGAPCVSPGEVGRGHGARINLTDLQRWLVKDRASGLSQRADEEVLALMARCFSDAIKRDRAHLRVDLGEAAAAGFLTLVYERCWMNVTQRSRDEIVLPPEIEHLCSIWVQSRQIYHRRQ